MVLVTCGPKNIEWEVPEINFIHFKLRTILSSVINSRAVQLRSAWDVNHLFVQHIHAVYTHSLPVSHLVAT